MIGILRGEIYFKRINSVILMVGGVGYVIYPPTQLLATIKPKDILELFIHTHVREDALQLFGFKTQKELELFELLLAVSGIGPKTALSIVDRGVEVVYQALMTADVSFFTSIPRLGTKNAQKIIIELKSKVGSIYELDLKGEQNGQTQEILDALANFGFTRQEALIAIRQKSNPNQSFEATIKAALKYLGRIQK